MRDTFSAIETYCIEKKISEGVILSMIIYDMIYDKIVPSLFVIEQCIDALFAPGVAKNKLLWQDYCDFLATAYKDNKKYIKQIESLMEMFDNMMTGSTQAIHAFADILDSCPVFEQQKNHYTISSALTIHFHVCMSDGFLDATHSLYMRTMQYWDGSKYYLSTMDSRDREKFVLLFMLHEAIGMSQPSVSLASV